MPKIAYKLLWLVLGAGLLVALDQFIKNLIWSAAVASADIRSVLVANLAS